MNTNLHAHPQDSRSPESGNARRGCSITSKNTSVSSRNQNRLRRSHPKVRLRLAGQMHLISSRRSLRRLRIRIGSKILSSSQKMELYVGHASERRRRLQCLALTRTNHLSFVRQQPAESRLRAKNISTAACRRKKKWLPKQPTNLGEELNRERATMSSVCNGANLRTPLPSAFKNSFVIKRLPFSSASELCTSCQLRSSPCVGLSSRKIRAPFFQSLFFYFFPPPPEDPPK